MQNKRQQSLKFIFIAILMCISFGTWSCKGKKDNPTPTTNAGNGVKEISHRYSGRWNGTMTIPQIGCASMQVAAPDIYIDWTIYSDSSIRMKEYQKLNTTYYLAGDYTGVLNQNNIQATMYVTLYCNDNTGTSVVTGKDTVTINGAIASTTTGYSFDYSTSRKAPCDLSCSYDINYSISK